MSGFQGGMSGPLPPQGMPSRGPPSCFKHNHLTNQTGLPRKVLNTYMSIYKYIRILWYDLVMCPWLWLTCMCGRGPLGPSPPHGTSGTAMLCTPPIT